MSHPAPDNLLSRRVADLERQVAQLSQLLRQVTGSRMMQPLNARLWRATLNEAFGDTTSHHAAADLVSIYGTDTSLDVDLYDALGLFDDLVNGDALYVLEQIDIKGQRYFVPIQAPCP